MYTCTIARIYVRLHIFKLCVCMSVRGVCVWVTAVLHLAAYTKNLSSAFPHKSLKLGLF